MSTILVGVSLTFLFVAMAFAVDIGAAYVERRYDQNAADAAVMSAAVVSAVGNDGIASVVDEVVDKVDIVLDRTVTTADWEACTDADAMFHTAKSIAVFNASVSPATECISFDTGFELLRVKIPDQSVPTKFATLVGVEDFTISAFAEAEIVQAYGGGSPPFIALDGIRHGDFACLRTSSSGDPFPLLNGNGPGVAPGNLPGDPVRPDPCDDNVYAVGENTFGNVLPWSYDTCTQSNAITREAIMGGIDHILGTFPKGYDGEIDGIDNDGNGVDGSDSRIRIDGDTTNNCTTASPNTLTVDTGFDAQMLRCALVTRKNEDLCEGLVARLHRGAYVDNDELVVGEAFDNVAPWDYLRPAAELDSDPNDVPLECIAVAASRNTTLAESIYDDTFDIGSDTHKRDYQAFRKKYNGFHEDQYWDDYDRFDEFDACLDNWSAGDGELFTAELGESPRFAFIPQVAEPDLVKVSLVHIEGFLPIYLYRLYVHSDEKADLSGSLCDPADGRSWSYSKMPAEGLPFRIHDAGHQYSCGGNDRFLARVSSLVFNCGMLPDTLCDKETGFPLGSALDIYDFHLRR